MIKGQNLEKERRNESTIRELKLVTQLSTLC